MTHADLLQATGHMLNRAEFPNIEDFLGIEWILEGCTQVQSDIEQMKNLGVLTTYAEERAHPIHLLWYKLIQGNHLPSDLITSKGVQLNKTLRQIHRLVVLENLIKELRPTWNSQISDDIRSKLRNRNQFASTLYELGVAENFNKFGYQVQFKKPSSIPTADLECAISDIMCDVECKRIEFNSTNYKYLSSAWNSIRESIAREVERIGQPTLINIAIYDSVSSYELNVLVELFKNMDTIPKRRTYFELGGRVVIYVQQAHEGRFNLDGDLDEIDHIHLATIKSKDNSEPMYTYAIAIQDHIPYDWASTIRGTLKSAIRQLREDKCNLVCVEVADLVHSDSPTEFWHVQEGIESFLERDSRRVSAVLLTQSGVTFSETDNKYVTTGRSWLFRNPNPYVALPDNFEVPKFDHPNVWVQGSWGKRC